MNGNQSSMCNANQISKNLPLKKRRAYVIDSANRTDDQDENFLKTTNNRSYGKEDSLHLNLSSGSMAPTPPASPHLELLRQQYAYFLANSTNTEHAHYVPTSNYDGLMAQKILAQQFLDNYRTLLEHQPQTGYTLVEDQRKSTDSTIDEHFRKSLGENYDKFSAGFLTPEDSQSNSSPTERTPTDSIEEHFARSLAKFWPLNSTNKDESMSNVRQRQSTESVVDDHFAKALGATTWEKLKEKS